MTGSTDEDDTDNVAWFCPYCERSFEGENGILIHLGQEAGHENHPEDIFETHTAADFPRVELTERGDIRRVLDEAKDVDQFDIENAAVPVKRVYRLIAERVADRDRLAAHQLRKQLLGVESLDRPVRDEPTHLDVYRVLMERGYGFAPDQDLSAILAHNRIRVALGDEASGDYSADDALDLAASLEQVADGKDWDEEILEFIEFLRYAAELLEEGVSEGVPVRFREWRDF